MIMRFTKPGGRAIFVIGDSQIAGERIDGGLLTVNSAESLGFQARIIKSVSMSGKSRSFQSSFQAKGKFEHIVEVIKS